MPYRALRIAHYPPHAHPLPISLRSLRVLGDKRTLLLLLVTLCRLE
jgi:hypothetical protein